MDTRVLLSRSSSRKVNARPQHAIPHVLGVCDQLARIACVACVTLAARRAETGKLALTG